MTAYKHTNELIKETSPYLLQHAHNPVQWRVWSEEALALAKRENKLLLISIGYSSCHWCHVMERESFEQEDVATVMNKLFINIKVDREERPDIDQVYMNAVQLITGSGGWPLHCIALPDGRPIWGGTYFRKKEWLTRLGQVEKLYREAPEKVVAYAEKLTEGIRHSDFISLETKKLPFTKEYLEKIVTKWKAYFDREWGGMNRPPKFPMPSNYQFLMRYAFQYKDAEVGDYVKTTLTKMAMGGIFDQIGGGFSRYSVDEKWHIPHFEKMLYDNGQLVSLYSNAYRIGKEALYKETVYRTLAFIERELMDRNGGFYSSIDADSTNEERELEEGAYYVWTKEELQDLLEEDFPLFSEYYNVNETGFWENGKYHLIRSLSEEDFAEKHQLRLEAFQSKTKAWHRILLTRREQRAAPRLDDKILTSWNALMLKGYIDAYRVFNESHFLKIALKNATFLERNAIRENGEVYHDYKRGNVRIPGYLEDYASVIDAYIALYEVTLDEKWLSIAKKVTEATQDAFFDTKTKMFFFTSDSMPELIARKKEVEDDVIPSSNAIMAKNLFKLGHFYEQEDYLNTSEQMVRNMLDSMETYGAAYSNWLDLYADLVQDYLEVVICGKDAQKKRVEIDAKYLPNKLLCGSLKESDLPLLKNRFVEDKTFLYICVKQTCMLPTEEVEKALQQIKRQNEKKGVFSF